MNSIFNEQKIKRAVTKFCELANNSLFLCFYICVFFLFFPYKRQMYNLCADIYLSAPFTSTRKSKDNL